jgi:pyrimidine-specific ribonucleoside hydrolase
VPVPVVSITDLYHPPEDPGDNLDLVMAYGLPEVDLRAVILDAWDGKRHLVDGGVPGYPGPRDPGIVPVTQLNAIFGRNVPFGMCPFTRMRSLDDRMDDVPAIQQFGVELLLRVLAESNEPVQLLSFGSARPLAVALNRAPELMTEKVARIHVSAGTTTPTYLEWNVSLDPLAMIRIVGSGLPLALYPCATVDSCYAYDEHNTFWSLPDLTWIEGMDPYLRRYLGYALSGSPRPDYLRALEAELPADVMAEVYGRRHSVWETAVWLEVSGRRLVRRADGSHRIVSAAEQRADDVVLRGDQLPCTTTTHDSGLYSFELSDRPTGTTIFRRDDPAGYERAMIEAMPALYQSFRPAGLPR